MYTNTFTRYSYLHAVRDIMSSLHVIPGGIGHVEKKHLKICLLKSLLTTSSSNDKTSDYLLF